VDNCVVFDPIEVVTPPPDELMYRLYGFESSL
jgi:hypothetical protein